MVNLPHKYRIYIFLAVALLTVGGLGLFFIAPYYNKITQLQTDIYSHRVQLGGYEQQRTNIEMTQQEYNKIKNRISIVSAVFTKDQEILPIISLLEEKADQYDIDQAINLKGTVSDSIGKKLAMTIAITGTWDASLDYLYALEQSSYYFIITNPVISLNDQGAITIVFNLSIYLLPT